MPRIEEKNGKTKVVFYERELRQFNECDRLIRLSIKMADSGTALCKVATAALNALENFRTEIRLTADPETPLLDKLTSQTAETAQQPASEPPTGDRVTAGPESPTSTPEAASSEASQPSDGNTSHLKRPMDTEAVKEQGKLESENQKSESETPARKGRRDRKQPA